jgi:DNA-binding beta-propeller fold protein YncE
MRVLSAGKGEVVALGFAPGRPALVAAGPLVGPLAWDLSADAPARRCSPHSYFRPHALAFTPAGGLVLPAGVGLVATDPATGDAARVGPSGVRPVTDFALTPDGGRLVTVHGGWADRELAGWRPAGAGWERDWSVALCGWAGGGLALSPTGGRVTHTRGSRLVGPGRVEVVVRDATTGEPTGALPYPYSYPGRFLFHPAGRHLVGVHEMTLLVWDLDRGGKPAAARNDSRRHFTAAAFHPAGRRLFTTSNDATVTVWDADTWAPVKRFTWDVGRLRSVAVSPDGTLAAAGSDKGRVVVWDVDL